MIDVIDQRRLYPSEKLLTQFEKIYTGKRMGFTVRDHTFTSKGKEMSLRLLVEIVKVDQYKIHFRYAGAFYMYNCMRVRRNGHISPEQIEGYVEAYFYFILRTYFNIKRFVQGYMVNKREGPEEVLL